MSCSRVFFNSRLCFEFLCFLGCIWFWIVLLFMTSSLWHTLAWFDSFWIWSWLTSRLPFSDGRQVWLRLLHMRDVHCCQRFQPVENGCYGAVSQLKDQHHHSASQYHCWLAAGCRYPTTTAWFLFTWGSQFSPCVCIQTNYSRVSLIYSSITSPLL